VKLARLPHGEDSLYPAVSLFAFGALASLAPEHAEPDDSLGEVIGRLHSLFYEEKKEGIHFFFEPTGKRPRFSRALPIQSDKAAKPCIKCSPFSKPRRGVRHFHQSLQLTLCPCAKSGKLRIGPLSEAARFADKMCQTGLSFVYPFSVNPVIVADKNTASGTDELFKSLPGPIGVDHKECNYGIGHYPQPVELAAIMPGRFIDMVYP